MNFLLSRLTVFTVVASESSYTLASVSQEFTPTGSSILTGCCTWLSTVIVDYGRLQHSEYHIQVKTDVIESIQYQYLTKTEYSLFNKGIKRRKREKTEI